MSAARGRAAPPPIPRALHPAFLVQLLRRDRLPRIELHSGPGGWTCVCHRQNGRFLKLPLGIGASAEGVKHAAAEAMLALGGNYDAELLALLAPPGA